MARFLKQRQQKKGLPPGSLVYLADKKHSQVRVTVINFSSTEYEERIVKSMEECADEALDRSRMTWIKIEGLSENIFIKDIGRKFGIHRLWLEDVLNTDHRPKIDELNDLVFVILKIVEDFSQTNTVSFEQVSLFLGETFVLSFQEFPGEIFDSVKLRLQKGQGKIRDAGADYLFYALIDSIIDGYLDVIEKLGQKIEDLEDWIAETVDSSAPQVIVGLKHELLYLAKSALPVRDALSQILRSSADEISPETKEYFKDAFDHSVQVVDTIESYKQMLVSLNDFYQSRVNQKMNEVMKILTVISTTFIPLTFIVGVYGMNFRHMPELEMKYGYLAVWILLLSIGASMVFFIRHKKWF